MQGPTAATIRSGRPPMSLHRRDRGFDHAGQGAAPAGVGGGDERACGSTIRTGAQSADSAPQTSAGARGDHAVALRRLGPGRSTHGRVAEWIW